MGLTIARAVMDMHGGRIEAHSDGDSRGSSFVVTLPLLRAVDDFERTDTSPVAPVAGSAHHRVLVVDDNIDAANSLAVLVEHWGNDVRMATHGEQALHLFAKWRPDTVLLDIGLPGIDGYQVARSLRALAGDAPLTIIAVTGYGREQDRALSADAGFDLHLVKPLDLTRLQALLGGPGSDHG